jgi:phosphocarrier protein
MVVHATLKIVNKAGLHARASTKFVQMANKYRSNVTVRKDSQDVNGKSIMGILLLVAALDSEISISCDGDDATDCLEALSNLVRNKFGED